MGRKTRNSVWMAGAAIVILSAAMLLGMAFASGGNEKPGTQKISLEQGWRLEQPVTYENLTIFPVVSAEDVDTSGIETLDAALASGDVLVTEQGDYLRRARDGGTPLASGGAQVNQLVLVNRGKKPLLLLAGEVVSGGKQDRIIGKDRIVPVGSTPLPLDVFCVEAGRWTGGSDRFVAAETMVHPTVREQAAVAQDQAKVWAAVRGEIASGAGGAAAAPTVATPPAISQNEVVTVMAESARTQSYRKIYQSKQVGTSVDNFAHEIGQRFDRATSGLKGGHVVGVVVAFGGEVAWSDIFASSRLFENYWPKLLRSYAIEALTRPRTRETASLDSARDFLRPATGHVHEESEPGVYRWREQREGRVAEIVLEALTPRPMPLHWLRVLRAD
jgi:hypothetical protein